METLNITTDEFWSAVKRKDVAKMLELTFAQMGYDEAAAVAHETNRMTNLAVSKMREVLPEVTETDVETDVEEEVIEADVEAGVEETEDDVNEIEAVFIDIKNLIEKGKGKKALKLIKHAKKDLGIGGSEIDKLKKQAKEL